MRYELIKDSSVGVVTDPTPILLDIKDTFEVSFLLPDCGAYIAIFRGDDNIEHKAVIKNSKVALPKSLLSKEQNVGLVVCQIDGENILHSWDCWGLRVGAFLTMRQSQRQVTVANDDSFLIRLAELERIHAQVLKDFDALQTENKHRNSETSELVAKFKLELYNQTEALASLKRNNEKVTAAYNDAIKVINDLSKRVTALEKNYDPTIIK